MSLSNAENPLLSVFLEEVLKNCAYWTVGTIRTA